MSTLEAREFRIRTGANAVNILGCLLLLGIACTPWFFMEWYIGGDVYPLSKDFVLSAVFFSGLFFFVAVLNFANFLWVWAYPAVRITKDEIMLFTLSPSGSLRPKFLRWDVLQNVYLSGIWESHTGLWSNLRRILKEGLMELVFVCSNDERVSINWGTISGLTRNDREELLQILLEGIGNRNTDQDDDSP